MTYQRQMGEPINLRAALPEVGRVNPVDFDSLIRNRLSPINNIGKQQTQYEAVKNMERQQAAYRQRLAALQNVGQQISSGGPVQLPNGKWLNPLGGNQRPWFGYGATYKSGKKHHGYDFAVKPGTPVYAPNAGTLRFAGWDNTGFGNALKMQLGNYLAILGHLSRFAPGIKAGMKITPGMLLGYTGNTGRSTGAHLHYEMQDQYGNPFNFGNWYGW